MVKQDKPAAASFSYLPHTEEERESMLQEIGVASFEDLIAHIPKDIRLNKLPLADGISELELTEYIGKLAGKNMPASKQASFLGGGAMRRFTPAAVSAIVSRSEFATAYTPYQPEVSQGTLQAIYEFQSAICLLTGMDVANASMYDGPTAAAEAALMAARLAGNESGREKILILETTNPEYRQVTETYLRTCNLQCAISPAKDGVVAPDNLSVTDDVAAVMVQYPNYFGCYEDLPKIAEAAHAAGALVIVITDPISLAVLEPPGKLGADIVVGDAQQCGNGLSFGGPSAGYMATRQEFIRQLPGRIVGMTEDNRGQRAFTLTLQTREQHIRRSKATSNICTNQSLNALSMIVYLCLMGPEGLKQICEISVKRAHHLAERLQGSKGAKLKFARAFFNEFVLEFDLPAAEILAELKRFDILGGIDLGNFFPEMKNCLLICTTELNSLEEIDRYAKSLASIVASKSNTAKPSGERVATTC